MEYLNT